MRRYIDTDWWRRLPNTGTVGAKSFMTERSVFKRGTSSACRNSGLSTRSGVNTVQHLSTSDAWRDLQPRNADEVLLDYGSGLGRLVILAAAMPFARIIGIELSPLLAERARRNLSICERSLVCISPIRSPGQS
jgi:hypothetical protein